MVRARILNPEAAEPRLDAIPLSQEILAEARAIGGPERCSRLDLLASQLHGVAPDGIEGDRSRIAFWINLYNALILHCLCLKPVRGSLLRHPRMFDRIAYRVGAHDYPLSLIENGLLRRNARPPYRLQRSLRPSDPRLRSAPSQLDPRIHFALNCGARSCPPIRVYEQGALDDQLDLATRSYLGAEAAVDAETCRITLPRLIRLYGSDFGGRAERLAFAARHLPAIGDCLRREGVNLRVRYARFDWTVAPPGSA